MTYSIRDGIGHWKGNSLSPEPCALCPAELRLHANLTVGAPDAPAISRPDVADVGMPIEHLDFEIACDARWGHEETGPPPAEWIVFLGGAPCSCAPLWRYFCDDCLAYERGEMGTPAICPDCLRVFKRVIRWEPLR